MLSIFYILELIKRLEQLSADYCDLIIYSDGSGILMFHNKPRYKAFITLDDLRDWLELELAPKEQA